MINKLYFNTEHIAKEDKNWIFTEIVKEQERVGYYSLPDSDIGDILEFENSLDSDIESIVVIGIGGSSLGTRAVYEFIKPTKKPKRKLYFFESTDPISIKATLKKIDLQKSYILVISKSGTTIETMAIFKYFYSLVGDFSRYCFITDSGSKLEKFAKSVDAKVFNIPTNVGGRFSVLSSVALVPLALSGIDIQKLLYGAKKIKISFFENGYLKDTILKKALFYAKNHANFNINVVFAYSEALEFFTKWYIQLWGESLGKRQLNSCFNVGVTPIGLIGPKDQHSFLQLIMQGTRDKSVTFIKIDKIENSLVVPNKSFEHLEELDIINNLHFNNLINMQCSATKEALISQKEIPVDEITLNKANENAIGQLIYYYELLTSLVGRLIDIDTYNQPGVELGKMILKKKLREE